DSWLAQGQGRAYLALAASRPIEACGRLADIRCSPGGEIDLRVVGCLQVAQRHRTAPERLVGEPRSPVLVARGDTGLVVQVAEVLLDRGLGDHELVRYRARGRRLGEQVAVQQRAAQRQQHVALARRERRWSDLSLRGCPGDAERVTEHKGGLADSDLVAG